MALRIRQFLASALVIGAIALPSAASALDDSQKAEFGAFIRDYLLANPELVEEMQQALDIKKQTELAKFAKAAIGSNADAIFNAPTDVVIGNPDGDVTIVEFFDYNCGFCKRAMSDMSAIVEKDKNVRFVLKEFPILGPDSLAAHRVSMAFKAVLPEKYWEFHLALMGGDVRADEAQAITIATSLGADEAQLRQAMTAPTIEAAIRETYELADALGMSGTPSYVVGDEAVFGAVGVDALMEKITNVRACKSTVC